MNPATRLGLVAPEEGPWSDPAHDVLADLRSAEETSRQGALAVDWDFLVWVAVKRWTQVSEDGSVG